LFDWSQYTNYAKIQRLKKNSILFRQGDKLNGFYYLQEGEIMISVLREDGYERIIDFVFPGSLIGEQMVNNVASFTTATLLMDSTVYYFTKKQFERLTNEHLEASQQFGYSLIKKIRMHATINSILNAPIDVQLAHFLFNLAERTGDNVVDITQTSIAKYLGKSRVALWKVLKEWRSEGIIKISNQTIEIKDLGKLKEKSKV